MPEPAVVEGATCHTAQELEGPCAVGVSSPGEISNDESGSTVELMDVIE